MKHLLGKNLKLWRKQRKMSQENLAFSTEISVHTISAFERGINFPRSNTIEKLSKVLNIPQADFYNFTEKTEKQDMIKEIVGILNILKDEELKMILKQVSSFVDK